MIGLLNTLSFVVRHPLNRHRTLASVHRYLRWQLGSRLVPGAVAIPFVNSTRLLVLPGMTGATQNVYCGLHEYQDMAFVLHALREDNLFVDIEANVGSYTVLAAGAVGARAICFEPVPKTFRHLMDNIRLNGLESIVETNNLAVGSSHGEIAFTAGLDTMNHPLADGERADETVKVRVGALDELLQGRAPCILKIDVEGYETEVLKGAAMTMQADATLAVLIELNGSGARYGHTDAGPHERLLEWGFRPARYDPDRRELTSLESRDPTVANSLYVKGAERLRERLRTAPAFAVNGKRV